VTSPIVDELKARGLEPAVDLPLSSSSFVSDGGKTIAQKKGRSRSGDRPRRV